MTKISKLFFLFCLLVPCLAMAQETTLKNGESFGLRISGVPIDEVQLVSAQYGISDAGTISLPYLKTAISAAGLTPSALARKIEAAYRGAQIYTQPTVQVDSSTVGTAAQRFLSVMGEVKAPRSVSYAPGMTLLDAIAQCSGFTDFADEKKVKLTRGLKVSYHRLSASDPKENVKVSPNDIITVRPNKGIFR
jgi:protein involved in polysaccharide export with SLBB domain